MWGWGLTSAVTHQHVTPSLRPAVGTSTGISSRVTINLSSASATQLRPKLSFLPGSPLGPGVRSQSTATPSKRNPGLLEVAATAENQAGLSQTEA